MNLHQLNLLIFSYEKTQKRRDDAINGVITSINKRMHVLAGLIGAA
jgi:hypothetical protein